MKLFLLLKIQYDVTVGRVNGNAALCKLCKTCLLAQDLLIENCTMILLAFRVLNLVFKKIATAPD